MRPRNYTKVPRPILWLVRGGEARIGDDARPEASPAFRVEIEPFYISKSPVTNEQFRAFDPSFDPSPASPAPRHVAMGISWRRARDYCDWYAELSRKPTRLPTEFEWEHACRGETSGPRFWGDADPTAFARFGIGDSVSAGGAPMIDAGIAGDWERLKPGPMGLHGMLGGVWEWTSSDWGPYPAVVGSAAWRAGGAPGRKVLRGGCYRDALEDLDAAARRAVDPDAADPTFGFRILRPFRR